jgi:hypothetical protein
MADGTVDGQMNDGTGIGGTTGFHNRIVSITGTPNNPSGLSGSNLNPGSLGTDLPNDYSTGIYEVGGDLYQFPNTSSQSPCCSFAGSYLIKSTDSGATWTTPSTGTAAFFANDWGQANFVKYGPGGIAPAIDNAQTYAYVYSNETDNPTVDPNGGYAGNAVWLARVPLSELPDLNSSEYQYYTGGDGMNNANWSSSVADATPIVSASDNQLAATTITYNAGLGRYVLSSYRHNQLPATTGAEMIMEADHPWGPWTTVMNDGFSSIIDPSLGEPYYTWIFLDNNAWTTDFGQEMWATVQPKNDYGLAFAPVYLTDQPVSTYQAESATITGGTVATSVSGYTGTGYVTGLTSAGDGVSFSVTAPTAGQYMVQFNYDTAAAGAAAGLYVNGTREKQIDLANTQLLGSNWMTATEMVTLTAGSNTVGLALASGPGDAGPFNLDKLAVAYYPSPATSEVNDNGSSAVTYSSGWTYDSSTSRLLDYDGDIHWTSTVGDWVQFAFTGTGADYINDKVTGLGTVGISIDGGTPVVVSSSGTSTRLYQQVVYEASGLSYGAHTMRVTMDTGPYASVDAFQPFTDVNDNASGVSYSSGWTYQSNSSRSTNFDGDVHYTSTTNAYMQTTFTGTRFELIGDTDPTGLSTLGIYIDGAFVENASEYAPVAAHGGQLIFDSGDLAYGTHTIKVVDNGTAAYALIDQIREF